MRKLDIVAGTKYNRWTIIEEVEKRRKYFRYVKCQCECGVIKEVCLYKVLNSYSISCGCFAKEIAKVMGVAAAQKNFFPYNFVKGQVAHNFVDGDNRKINKTECYYIARLWQGIKQRCYNPNEKGYKWYGARGIKMYEPWIKDRQLFKQWILENLGHRPEGYSIDRINVDGNYEPDNLRWADKATQNKNRRCMKKNV